MYAADTIAAVASPPGRGAVGILRISGPAAARVLAAVFRPRSALAWKQSHRLYLGDCLDAAGRRIDEGLSCLMRAPASFTGEDVAEIQCHGSPAVLGALLASALAAGARAAEPGEFARRAFLNGRIDLLQAEAIDDLIRARSGGVLHAAAGQLAGFLSKAVEDVRSTLIELKALLEVQIDFSDEDVHIAPGQLLEPAASARDALAQLVASYRQGKRLREGVRVAIVGRPNVGKSSLLNALLGEERAIVTEIAGTTRDVIEESVEIDGLSIALSDTAGLRAADAADPVERIGMERTRQRIDDADVVVLVIDGSMPVTEEDRQLLASVEHERRLVVVNKADLVRPESAHEADPVVGASEALLVSARVGTGMDELRERLRRLAVEESDRADRPLVMRLRQRDALQRAAEAVELAIAAIARGEAPDLIAVDVQDALDAIGDLTGVVTNEDVLDVVFSRFCLGK